MQYDGNLAEKLKSKQTLKGVLWSGLFQSSLTRFVGIVLLMQEVQSTVLAPRGCSAYTLSLAIPAILPGRFNRMSTHHY